MKSIESSERSRELGFGRKRFGEAAGRFRATTESDLCPARLEVTEEGDVIVLTGKVGSCYFKQLAQETVISVTGQREIHNNIRVHKLGSAASERTVPARSS